MFLDILARIVLVVILLGMAGWTVYDVRRDVITEGRNGGQQ